MYEDFHLTLSPSIAVPTAEGMPDMSHYNHLLASAPMHALGLPYLLDCLIEQVVRTHAPPDMASNLALADSDAELEGIAAFLQSATSLASAAPKSAMQLAAEAATKAADASALVPTHDHVTERLYRPPPFGLAPTASSGDKAAAIERKILGLLPYPGKGRRGMPSEDAALSAEERGAERTELHHFSQFAPPQVSQSPPPSAPLVPPPRRLLSPVSHSHRAYRRLLRPPCLLSPPPLALLFSQVDAAMQLRALARMCNANDPYRGLQSPGWVLADRVWLEELSPETLSQVMLDASATSAPYKALSSYHARDDVMLIAQHRPVPAERVESWSRRCPLTDLVERKFGAWHEWLMKGQAPDVVPAPPMPPSVFNVNEGRVVGAALYKVDEAKVDLFETATLLMPSDHTVVRYAPSGAGHLLSLFFRHGGYVAMRKPITADSCELAISFADGARAAVDIPDEAEGTQYGVAYGGHDGVQVTLDVLGVTRMMPPPPSADAPSRPTPAAKLTLTGLVASGVPDAAARPDGGDVYVRVTALEATPPPGVELAASSAAVPVVASAGAPVSFGDAPLVLSLPAGTPRPVRLLVELWDSDAASGGTPIASAVLGANVLPASGSGMVYDAPLAARAEGASPLLVTFCMALADAPTLKPAPAPPETARTVLATGSVAVKYADGTIKCLLRDGNLCERSATGPLANVWVVTNMNGLRVGTKDDGTELFVPPVKVASATDPTKHHVMTTRGDGTLVVSRSDGSRLVQFADGTTIDSSAEAVKFGDRGEVRVNCEGYPPVRLALKQLEVEISCLDGTMLKAELASVAALGCVKLNHLDGTVLKLTSDGKTSLFPAPLAWVENADGKSGVYHIDLASGVMYTKDPAGSTFKAGPGVDGGHDVDLVMTDDLAASLEDASDGDAAAAKPVDEDNPDWSHPPRLFVVRPDGSGVELLRQGDVRSFVKQREAEIEGGTAMLLREPLPSEPSAEVFTYVWRDWMQMHLASLEAERRESDAISLLGYQPKVDAPPASVTTLHFRRLLTRETLNEPNREKLEIEISNMNHYREQEEIKAHELHVTDIRTEEEKAMEAEAAREMLKVRALRRRRASALEPARASGVQSGRISSRGRLPCRRVAARVHLRRRPSSVSRAFLCAADARVPPPPPPPPPCPLPLLPPPLGWSVRAYPSSLVRWVSSLVRSLSSATLPPPPSVVRASAARGGRWAPHARARRESSDPGNGVTYLGTHLGESTYPGKGLWLTRQPLRGLRALARRWGTGVGRCHGRWHGVSRSIV